MSPNLKNTFCKLTIDEVVKTMTLGWGYLIIIDDKNDILSCHLVIDDKKVSPNLKNIFCKLKGKNLSLKIVKVNPGLFTQKYFLHLHPPSCEYI